MAVDTAVVEIMLNKLLDSLEGDNSAAAQEVLNRAIIKLAGHDATRKAYEEVSKNFNPYEGIQNYGYRPMKPKKNKDGTEETPQDTINRYERHDQLRSILGDIFQGVGSTLAIKNQAKSQALQNVANTRSQRERELYGANASDYAAAMGAPAAEGLAKVEQLVASLLNARIQGDVALSRQARQQAILDAYQRNVGASGMFYDARRKTDGLAPGMGNIK